MSTIATVRTNYRTHDFVEAEALVEQVYGMVNELGTAGFLRALADAIDEPGPPAVEVTPKASLRAALNTVGYDDDRIFRIDRDGAYWDDANPLVRACRKVSR